MHIKGRLSKKQRREREYKQQLEKETGVYVADTIKMPEQWELTRYVINGITAFLGSFGAVDCFLSSFSIDYNELLVASILFIASVYVAMIYHRYKNLGYALFFVVYLQTILQFREEANSGFASILNVVQSFLSQEIGLPSSSRYVESVSDTQTAVSICAIYIGCLVVVLLNIAIAEYMNVGDIICVTLPVAQLGMLFDRQPSAVSFLMMLFSWIFVATMKVNYHYRKKKKGEDNFRYKRKKHRHQILYRTDSKANAQIILAIGAFVFVTVTLLTLLVPSGFRNAVQSTNTWREDTVAQIRYLVENGFEDFFKRQGAGGVNGGRLGEVGTVRFDNQTDIIVRMAPYKTERIYLKAYTGTDYTGRSWEVAAEDEWKEWRSSIISTSAEEIANASYRTLKNRKGNESIFDSEVMPSYYSGKMQITNMDANNMYLYLPYYPHISSLKLESRQTAFAGNKIMAIVQDDLIYNQMPQEIPYHIPYIDMDLTVRQLDEILAGQKKKDNPVIVTEDDDVNRIYLANRDGSNRQKIEYLEKEQDLVKYDRKRAKKQGIESYSIYHRYFPNDVIGEILVTKLYALGETVTGIAPEELLTLDVASLQHNDWLYDGKNKVFWGGVNLEAAYADDSLEYEFAGFGKEGEETSYEALTKESMALLETEGLLTASSIYPFNLNEYYLNLAVFQGEQIHPMADNGILTFRGGEDTYIRVVNNTTVVNSATEISDDVQSQKYIAAEMNDAIEITNAIDTIGLENGSRHKIADSITDYYYRGYIASHYLDVPRETREVLADFCREYGINAEDEHVLEEVVDALDEHCNYVLNPGVTPTDQDFVSYFLQKQEEGFCVHFASAAALLYRYLGIPARYCEGYAIDYVDALSSTLVEEEDPKYWVDNVSSRMGGTAVLDIEIPDANAHAWVEIYLDDYGWVPIDPTPAAGIENDFDEFWEEYGRDDDEDDTAAQLLQGLGMRVLSAVASKALAVILFVVIPCIVFVIWQVKGAWLRRKRIRSWNGRDKKENVVNLYHYVTSVMAAVGNAQDAGMTYEEYADVLVRENYLSEENALVLMQTVEEAAYAKEEPDSDRTEIVMKLMQSMVEDAYHRQKWYRRLVMKFIKNL